MWTWVDRIVSFEKDRRIMLHITRDLNCIIDTDHSILHSLLNQETAK